MENGKETHAAAQGVSLELNREERGFVVMTHANHLKCELVKCGTHALVHMIFRLEAERLHLEHNLEATLEGEMGTHGVNGLCERCTWTPMQWIRSIPADWGKQ